MNANINGANLYYEIHGKGDPLLMIQGWGAEISNWQNVIQPLSKNFQLILFDNRGMGRSEVTPGDYTTRLMADDAAALLEHLQISQTHVLGWSMGGAIAQELALAYPEKVNRLVLYATAAKFSEKSVFVCRSQIEAIERQEFATQVNWEVSFCFSEVLFADQARLAEVLKSALNPQYPGTLEGLISQFVAVASHDTRGQLGSIKSPTLVIGAEEDSLIRIDNVKSLAGEIKNAELKVLPGAHMCHIEKAAEFSQAVTEFLRK
ncbi:alpha/beta fold hydrolase [Fischerella sp. PCC 9605]|uniref:alpha/beta fold hydrolase n=1 Tax=Fischerella sp. PCC 9605 TaxID=1173024 RepID=UPI00047A28EB|nr:alpha/beta hydrolase [Fischerella sp. PCC 9605]